MRRPDLIAIVLLAPLAVRAQDSSAAKITLHGVVRDASTSAPIDGAELRISSGSNPVIQATTDAQGQFTLDGLDPGHISIYAFHFFLGGSTTKVVDVRPNPEPVEIRLRTGGHISGRVLDPDGNPLGNVTVNALYRVWSNGTLEYRETGSDQSRADGQYYLDGLAPGRGYIIQAHYDRSNDAKTISEVPEDPKLRKEIWAPTYYPSVDSPGQALAIPLESNDEHDHVDIQLRRSPSFCVSGEAKPLDGAGVLRWALSNRPPSAGATTGDDLAPGGNFRICDLYPGAYSLYLTPRDKTGPRVLGAAAIAILDRDVEIDPVPLVSLDLAISGQIVWDGTPPQLDSGALVRLQLARAADAFSPIDAAIPLTGNSPFSLKTPVAGGELSIRISQLPPGVYAKSLAYNGASILNGMAIPAAPGNLLITLATDGARITANVTGKDGQPLPETNIAVFPASPATESALAASIRSGKTGAQGNWTSELLPPGKYSVLATPAPVDQSYESIEKLWLARTDAQTVDLTPGSATPVTIVAPR